MATDSLVYSLIQIIHNLNAVVVVGAPLFGVWFGLQQITARQMMALVAFAWALQGISGAAFGLASLSLYGALPDLHPIGRGALVTKVACVIVGFGLSLWFWLRPSSVSLRTPWMLLGLIGVLAISAAAVLRWNS